MKYYRKCNIGFLCIILIMISSCVSHQFIPSIDNQSIKSNNIKLPVAADINIQIRNSNKSRDIYPTRYTHRILRSAVSKLEFEELLRKEFEELFDYNAKTKIPMKINVKELSIYYPGYFTTWYGWLFLTIVPFTWVGIPAGPIKFKATIQTELFDTTFTSTQKVRKSGSLYYNNVHAHFWTKQKNIIFSQSALKAAIEDLKNQIISNISNFRTSINKTLLFTYDELLKKIEIYVNKEIRQWETKGDYEKLNDYKQRVTVKNREIKIVELTQQCINEIALNNINLIIKSHNYDPDNEVYKLEFVGLEPIYFTVPYDQVSSFDQTLNDLKLIEPQFALSTNGIVIRKLQMFNKKNDKTYTYDSKNELVFNNNLIKTQFSAFNINTIEFNQNAFETSEIINMSDEIYVDNKIPETNMSQPNAVAIIIGNKDYQNTSTVDYALNDANAIKKYLVTSLGFKEGNILYKENINKADFEEIFGNQEFHEGRLYNMVKPNVSEVFIFYSGHGAPGIKNFKTYFIPILCDPNYLEFRGYSFETFYKNLSKLPAKNITVVIDACFSGENVHKDISSILPKVKDPVFMIPNGVLLSSSRATEPSCWFNDQEHGLFTYFFLRAIKDKENSDTNKDERLTFQEVYNYISSQTEGIPYYARRIHGKEQHPTIKGNPNRILVEY